MKMENEPKHIHIKALVLENEAVRLRLEIKK
jgi:hypothetical protein